MRAEESRVLVVAPVGLDAEAMAAMLRGQGIITIACAGPGECLQQLAGGAGAVLLTDEALESPVAENLLETLRHQPAWSELPVIILTSGGEARNARLLEIAERLAGGVTLLERPMATRTLLQSVRVALRSRQRQYQVRDLLAERERAEQALRLANERLSYHVHNTPLAVVEFDAELKVCAWSEGAERTFGWTAPEVIGRHMGDIGWISAEDRTPVEQVTAGLASGQTPRSTSLNRNLRKDGAVIWCEWYNSSLRDASGKVQSIMSLVLDVTKRIEAEAVLARDKEQLEALVAERTAALRDLVGELEHFSYSITHDMRAPLRAMMGFSEVAKELCVAGDRQEQKMFLDRIQTAAKRMDLLITDALNYSKAVRSELPLAPIDLGRLLRGMVDTYPELQLVNGSIRIEPDLPLVMGNEAGLTQCFSNLLVNAVKFARPGEAPQVRIWGEALHTQSSVLSPQTQPRVRIWVEDQGIGIGPSMLGRLFQMFARGASDRAGTGIGLALVRKVVQRMGGRVGVESEEGRGSRFWVELMPGDVRGTGKAEPFPPQLS